MKLEFDGHVLTLISESDADDAEITRLFGARNEHGEFSGAAFGRAIQIGSECGSVEVSVAEASWNWDD